MISVGDDDSSEFGAEKMKLGSSSLTHCCDHCGKRFGSGKALGGHLRIHRSSGRHHPWSNSVSIACRVCGKKFPSLKAVFGHMRAHPDRERSRPTQPPATFSGDQVSTSSSSTLSENNNYNPMHDFDAAAVAGPSSIMDLTKSLSLSGWSVTAKRGTTAMAKKQLSTVTCQEPDSRLSDYKQKNLIDVVHGDFFCRNIREKGTIGEGNPKSDDRTRDLLSNLLNKVEELDESWSTEDILQRKLKKMRKLSELGPKSKTPPHAAAGPKKSTYYSCNTCGVSFPTHQALGGHVSSHKRKLRSISSDLKEKSNYSATTITANLTENCNTSNKNKEESSMAPSQTTGSKKSLRFDLNELPPMEDR